MIELGSGAASSTAEPRLFFQRWLDHETWPAWSPDTAWVRLDGPPVAGSRGTMKPTAGPKVAFTIAVCEPDHEYTDVTTLPGARLTFAHTVQRAGAGSTLEVLVTITGPLAPVWARVLGRGFRESAQADLDRLVALVEAGRSAPAPEDRRTSADR